MSASKRNFQDFNNTEEFNFYIYQGVIRFPTLYNLDTKGNLRVWDIFIELYNDNNKLNIEYGYIDNINIIQKRYTNLYVKLYTKTGIKDMKLITSLPTIISSGKNIGKKNETNILTQALIQGRSKYLKKIDAGYSMDIVKNVKNIIPYPMALHKYDDFKQKIKYPCYIQPKLDGIRIFSFYDKDTDEVIFKSRKLKDILGFEYIKDILYPILKENPSLFIDGELYCHGMSLQDISGIVRNENKDIDNNILKFNIFDCFDVNNASWKFIDRIAFLNNIFVNGIDCNNYIIVVSTELVQNEVEGDNIYNKYISNNYEGAVYKNLDSIYKFNYNKEHRSYDILKRKKQFDEEFEIVDYTTGVKGRAVGCIIFIMKTKNGKLFNVTPNITIEKQQEMYNLAINNFNNLYKGKMATIKYDDLSKDGIPLRAKWITIRDYE